MALKKNNKNSIDILRNGRTAFFGNVIADMFTTGDYEKPDDDQEWLEECRELCRGGNPFPLMALQWPRFIVKNPDHYQFFEGDPEDPYNPVLRIDKTHRDIIRGFFDRTVAEIFVKGSTGSGKGFSAAIGTNLLFDSSPVARIHITSRAWKDAQENMFNEISSWYKKMKYPTPARVSTTSFYADERKYIVILNPAEGGGEAFSGRHAGDQEQDYDFFDPNALKDHAGGTYYIFDEASAISRTSYDNAMKNAFKLIALSNPRVVSGWFREGFRVLEKEGKDEDQTGRCKGIKTTRLCVTAGGKQCTNVVHERLKDPVAPVGGIKVKGKFYDQGEFIPPEDYQHVRALIPGQMDLQQYRMISSDPREHIRDCFAEGRFIKEDPEFQNILQSWLPPHIDAYNKLRMDDRYVEVNTFSFDAARSANGDKCALCAGSEDGIHTIHKWNAPTYLESAENIIRIAKSRHGIDLTHGAHPVVIDFGGGYGAGVAEHLRLKGVWVVEFHPSGSARFYPKEYKNRRTEAYALLSRRLDPKDFWSKRMFALPPDDELQEELVAPYRKYPEHERVKFGLESKEEIKEKLNGRSPDSADAVAMMFDHIFESRNYANFIEMMRNNFTTSYADMEEEDIERIEKDGHGAAAAKIEKGESVVDYINRTYGGNKELPSPAGDFDINANLREKIDDDLQHLL